MAHSNDDVTLVSGKYEICDQTYDSCENRLFWVATVER
jgi:hypothetical protein